jgi:hypothetical protein
VSFTPLPLYPLENSPRYILDRRLGGPQSQSGRWGVEIHPLHRPGIEPLPSSLHFNVVGFGIFTWGRDAVYFSISLQMFRNIILPLSSGSSNKEVSKAASRVLHARYALRLPFDREDRSSSRTFPGNVGEPLPDYRAPHPRSQSLFSHRYTAS